MRNPELDLGRVFTTFPGAKPPASLANVTWHECPSPKQPQSPFSDSSRQTTEGGHAVSVSTDEPEVPRKSFLFKASLSPGLLRHFT